MLSTLPQHIEGKMAAEFLKLAGSDLPSPLKTRGPPLVSLSPHGYWSVSGV